MTEDFDENSEQMSHSILTSNLSKVYEESEKSSSESGSGSLSEDKDDFSESINHPLKKQAVVPSTDKKLAKSPKI